MTGVQTCALPISARGHVQEQGRVRAPPQLGLDTAKHQQPCPALGGLPGPKRDPRPADRALPLGAEAHDGPDRGKVDKRLWIDRGERRGRELADEGAQRTRRRIPGIDPAPNATTIVGMLEGSSP